MLQVQQICKTNSIKASKISKFFDFYSYEKRQESIKRSEQIKSIITTNKKYQDHNDISTTTIATIINIPVDLINLILDYSIGDKLFWKCYMNDVVLHINKLPRINDTQLSYYLRTGISSGSLYSLDNDEFNIPEDVITGKYLIEPDLSLQEKLVSPSVYLFACVPDEYFCHTWEDTNNEMWLNEIKRLILEYVGYDYWFIVK